MAVDRTWPLFSGEFQRANPERYHVVLAAKKDGKWGRAHVYRGLNHIGTYDTWAEAIQVANEKAIVRVAMRGIGVLP
ncbi:hypothetical protein ABRQ22_17455 [Cellulosimicrobium sp. ES-005]|uniref:AP2/ERF domain-containing protein n=1 Tax=Cellulosimicrobium sp. ES-005 TaxID=3163031 RepID=A0AAU8FZH6_9MICO